MYIYVCVCVCVCVCARLTRCIRDSTKQNAAEEMRCALLQKHILRTLIVFRLRNDDNFCRHVSVVYHT